jgi:hypothetical protein
MLLRVFSCILLLSCIHNAYSQMGGVYTYPVKSINLPASPEPGFFTQDSLDAIVEDAHAVHGIQVSDGYILCGAGKERPSKGWLAKHPGQKPPNDAFVVKFMNEGFVEWTFNPGHKGGDACNSVTELPDGSILAAGYQIVGGIGKRTIHRLNGASGKKIWMADGFGDVTTHGAYEMVNFNKGCGNGVLLSGLAKSPHPATTFKSYGNSAGGVAVVEFIPLAELMRSTPPTKAHVAWSQRFYQIEKKEKVGIAAAKNSHCTAKGDIAVLLWSEKRSPAGECSFAALDSTGAVIVAPKHRINNNAYECTDMNVDKTGTFAYTTGHGHDPVAKVGYKPFITKVRIADGKAIFTKAYEGGGGNPKLIFNECFGIVTQKDGVLLSCGTGIEDCNKALGDAGETTKFTKSAKELAACKAGKADKRKGAMARKAGIWQLLVIKAGFDGTLKWQQVMSFKPKGAPALGAPGWVSDSSGGEWAIATKDGGFAIVADQQNGVGVMKSKDTPWGARAPVAPGQECKNNHAGLAKAAAALTPPMKINNCAELAAFFNGNHCSDPTYSAGIKRLCPKTCACKPPACCASEATAGSLAQVDAIVPEREWYEEVRN